MTQGSAYVPETIPAELALVSGGAQIVRLELLDEDGQAEDLSGASAPKVDIAEASGETPIISKVPTIEPGGDKGVLEFTLTAVDTALLSTGTYVAQAQVTIGGNNFTTDNFYVKVAGKVVA